MLDVINKDIINKSDNIISCEIVNCNWKTTEWDTVPYFYRVHWDAEGLHVTEVYSSWAASYANNDIGVPSIGYKQNGVWLIKRFEDNNYSYWGGNHECFWRVQRSGVICEWYGHSPDKYKVGLFGYQQEVDSAPVDTILPVLRSMKTKKWRGFYDDDVDYIAETAGVRKDQI